jgi:hypothetical protein
MINVEDDRVGVSGRRKLVRRVGVTCRTLRLCQAGRWRGGQLTQVVASQRAGCGAEGAGLQFAPPLPTHSVLAAAARRGRGS